MINLQDKTWSQLLYLYDYNIRNVAELQTDNSDREDSYYACGYADAIGQVILDLGKYYGEGKRPYKFEAYKRVMEFTNAAAYVKKYPKSIESPGN